MRHRRLLIAITATCAALALTRAASADILITVDKSAQQMTVSENGALLYTWPVSTGAPGYDTPSGEFKPFRMERDHFSREWDDAPMPNSIFFTREGHAIHGSGHTKAIGSPVSHGCVRLMPKNASILFDLVKHEGMNHTRVVLTGETPEETTASIKPRKPEKPANARISSNEEVTASLTHVRHARAAARNWRAAPRYYYVWHYPQRYYYIRPPYAYGW